MIKNRFFSSHSQLRKSLTDLEEENTASDSSLILEDNPFEKAIQDYFRKEQFFSKQSKVAQDMQIAKEALSEMNEAMLAFQMLKEMRKKLESLYLDLKIKSEN